MTDFIWCKCGHVEGTHFSDLYERLDTFFKEGGSQIFVEKLSRPCHAKDCDCQNMRPKKHMNRIKFFFTGKG